jgi:hypothetical protein
MSLLQNSNAISAEGGYDITDSLRFRASAGAYLSRTASTAPTSNQKGTFSFWFKRSAVNYATEQWLFSSSLTNRMGCYIGYTGASADQIALEYFNALYLVTNQVFRDPSSWYHMIVAIDTTQATSSDRVKMYINGIQVTSFSYATYPAQNAVFDWMANGQLCRIGDCFTGYTGRYYDGYITEFNYIDGQQLTPSDFGETDTTTGVWKPKEYTGTYGTNGFYLNFSDGTSTTTLGYDYSGNSNNWTTNNISLTTGATYDLMSDTPSLADENTGNFATINPLDKTSTISSSSITNANLTASIAGGAGSYGEILRTSTINLTPDIGKIYWEAEITSLSGGTFPQSLIFLLSPEPTHASIETTVTFSAYTKADGLSNLTNAPTFTTGDSLMFAYDSSTGKYWVGKNGTWTNSGDPAAGTNEGITISTTKTYAIMANMNTSGASVGVFSMNFGQRPFKYTPPTGFKKLNTFNLPDSSITDGSEYFDTKLWAGNGTSQNITMDFSPDFTWIKIRSGANLHVLSDTVRGNTKYLFSDTTGVESTVTDAITSFNSDGVSLGVNNAVNASGHTFVGWNWRGSDSTAVSNTDGTITSTVSANTTSGFSVVTYTGNATAGATVGHGLGTAPKMVIVKQRNGSSYSWTVHHDSLTSGYVIALESTSAQFSRPTAFNSTAPSANTFTLGTDLGTNSSGGTYVAYCFADVEGFSKFGSYTGNGSADGTFVYTGFRPAFVLIKQSSSSGNSWQLLDTSRETTNPNDTVLFPNLSNAEGTLNATFDFLSNGFKVRTTDGTVNTSGSTYIYMAFAENPFKNSLAR